MSYHLYGVTGVGRMYGAVVFCASLFLFVEAGNAPFITPCVAADNSCHKSSAQKAVPILAAGIPELGLAPMDPMDVGRVKANQAGLDMDFKNTVVKGLRNCLVLGLKRQGRKVNIELKCSITVSGDYVLGGRLLILPVEGDGKYKIKIRDLVVKIAFEIVENQKDGEAYWQIGTWKQATDVETNVEFAFQNLFNGNKQLSDAIHQFANTNWREIYQEVAPPVVKAIVTSIVEAVKKFFDKVPKKELTLD